MAIAITPGVAVKVPEVGVRTCRVQIDVLTFLRLVVEFTDESEAFPHLVILLGTESARPRASNAKRGGARGPRRQGWGGSRHWYRSLWVWADILGPRGSGAWSLDSDISSFLVRSWALTAYKRRNLHKWGIHSMHRSTDGKRFKHSYVKPVNYDEIEIIH